MHLRVDHPTRVQLALCQHGMPLVREVVVDNRGGEAIDDATIVVRVEPPIAPPLRLRQALGADARVSVTPTLVPSLDALAAQQEISVGAVHVEVRDGDRVIAAVSRPVEILPANHWPGADAPPELLAAWVQPSAAAIPGLLRALSSHLADATGDGAIDGYQSRDPGRARAIVAAAYTALCALHLVYAEPPPGFATHGQRIRSPDAIVADRLGACLDLACLAAGVIEAAGLGALVVVVDGHALCGAWLVDDHLAAPTVDEPLALRKRVELDEVVVFDPTLAVGGAPFLAAVGAAAARFTNPDDFRFAIDVRAARAHRVRPLPLRADGVVVVPAPELAVEPAADAPGEVAAARATRLERWKSRLLDLSLRNRLIAYRTGRTALPLAGPGAAEVVRGLASGAAFEVHERGSLPPDADVVAHTSAELAARRLRAALDDAAEVDRRLLELYRADRAGTEESGAVTVYVVAGFLRWFEGAASDTPRLAPLLLLPAHVRRASVRDRFRVVLADDDEPRINATLLAKLERDHGLPIAGLDTVPEDHDGLPDTAAVLRRFRTLVKTVPRWEVVDTVHVARLAFTRFLMWRDLEARTASLLESPVVRHLLTEDDTPFASPARLPQPGALSTLVPAWNELTVLDADSSQQVAIEGALAGGSLVLQGPPGTGKSQTIANLIARALAAEHTVLFVSEKMAALDVVHERLARVGLAPFCLELHSSKASKREVAEQLQAAFAVAARRDPEGWRAHAEALQAERMALDATVRALHAPDHSGLSSWQAASTLVAQRATPDVDVVPPSTADARSAQRDAAGRVADLAAEIGPISAHPWLGTLPDAWTVGFERDVAAALTRARAAVDALPAAMEAAAAVLSLPAGQSVSDVRAMAALAEALLSTPFPPRALVEREAHDPLVVEWIAAGRTRDAAWSALAVDWTERLFDLDLPRLQARYRQWGRSFFAVAWVLLFTARSALRAAARHRLPPRPTIARDLDRAMQVRELEGALAAADRDAKVLLGPAWRGVHTDWNSLDHVLAWARDARARLPGGAARRHAVDVATRESSHVAAAPALEALVAAWATWEAALRDLDALVILDGPLAHDLPRLTARLGALAEATHTLRDWTAWRRVAAQAYARGLGAVVAGLGDGTIEAAEVVDAVDKAVARARLDAAADDPALEGFRGRDHEARIARFTALDERALVLARDEVVARLCARLPDPAAPGDMAVVRREALKKRRHLPIRRLFAEIGPTLLRLKPCVLMSPLSVAQYLDPALDGFDLVVFDEASQIPPWDAVGALARGRHAVVVGDSRQLPPTTFFQREDGDDDLDAEDLESVLDDCVAAGLPVHDLRWHYRSRHDALIGFSNARYYGDRLHVFPSAHRGGHLGVQLVKVDGFYDRGRTRTNPAEAEAVVAEIARRAVDPLERRRSLGVVTFSTAQQRLVEDLVDALRRQHPDVDAALAEHEEPLFVKNLESVQGDERDVVLFSVGYGPDRDGRVAMHFGPLNRDGGERRLNVAVTRAREQMVVFSTLAPEDIDLHRTSAVGVHHLRAFLEHAARGGERDVTRAADVGVIAVELAAALDDVGLRTVLGFGRPDVGVDVAVFHPDEPERALLGVLLDGPAYGALVAARDRDRIRPAMLAHLGWTLVHVWTLDWLHDPAREIARVVDAVAAARRGEPTAEAPRPDAPTPPPPPAPAAPRESVPYRRIDAPDLGGKDAFERPDALPLIARRVRDVVAVEAPIVDDLALRRVIEAWGLKRVTDRVRSRVLYAARALPPAQRPVDRHGVWWRADQDPATWRDVRVPAPGDVPRPIEHLPAEEVANAVADVVERAVGIERDDLVREVAQQLGFARTGARIHDAVSTAVERCAAEGRVVLRGSRVQLPG